MTSLSGRELKCCSASFAIFLVGFLVFIAAVASPQWYSQETAASETHIGVFWMCQESPEDDCEKIELSEQERWWRGSAGMLATTLVLSAVAGFVAMFPPISAALQITAGVVGITGSVVFIIEIDDLLSGQGSDTSIDWGFYLGVIGGALLLLNGVGLAIACFVSRCTLTFVCCCCGEYKRHSDLPRA